MPIYEYSCSNCGLVFEKLSKLGDSEKPCTNCGTSSKKIISAPTFKFNGSGFYETDYKNVPASDKNS